MELVTLFAQLWSHYNISPYAALSIFIMICFAVLFILSIPTIVAFSTRQLHYYHRGLRSVSVLNKKIDFLQDSLAAIKQQQDLSQQDLKSITNYLSVLNKFEHPPLTEAENTIESGSYQYAKKLLKNGYSLAEVIHLCHLSEGEANVLQALYGASEANQTEFNSEVR